MSEVTARRSHLLDTHMALWALEQPESMTASARKAVSAGPNVLSVVTYWEVMLKSMKGKLDLDDPRSWDLEAPDELAATPLLLRPEHVNVISTLQPIHKGPFDRILIGQATVEWLTLVTADAEIARYASTRLSILR